MSIVKYIAFLSIILICLNSNAQEKLMAYSISANYHSGFILAHRNDIEVLLKDYTRFAEISFSKHFEGKNDWEQKYVYPYFGGSIMLFDFGNKEQIGRGVSIFAFYNFPLVQTKNFELNFKLGFGPGYVEKVFDKKENFQNYGVSTNFNGFVHGNLMGRYTLKDAFFMSAGLSFSHFSNAATKKPNLGLNIPALNVGVGYRFKEIEKTIREKEYAYEFDKKWNHDVVLGLGRKSNSVESGQYGVVSLAYGASKHISFKSKLGGGADFFYNSALRGEEGGNEEILNNASDIMQLGVNVSYTLQISNLSVFFNQGVYVYTKYKEDGPMYNRFGFRYQLNNNLILNLSMKTHFAVADFVELGIGYRF